MLLKNKLTAMTLAEVLLTLVIIGVVAALTIPGLRKASQRDIAVVQLKKAYKTLNGALDFALAENLDLKIESGQKVFTDYMIPRMVVNQYCDSSNMSKCFPNSVKNLEFTPAVAVQLADGNSIAVSGWDFVVDVNGPELPNVEGVDVFQYRLQKISNGVAMKSSNNPVMAFFQSLFGAPAYAITGNDTSFEKKKDPNEGWNPVTPPSSSSSSSSSSSTSSSGRNFNGDDASVDPGSLSTSGTLPSSSSSTSSSSTGSSSTSSSSSSSSTGSSSTSSSSSSSSTSSSSTGSSSTSSSSSSSSSSGGTGNDDYSSLKASGWQFIPKGSAAKVMEDSWKIKYW